MSIGPLSEDLRELIDRAGTSSPPAELEDAMFTELQRSIAATSVVAAPPLVAAFGKWGLASAGAALLVGFSAGALVFRDAVPAPIVAPPTAVVPVEQDRAPELADAGTATGPVQVAIPAPKRADARALKDVDVVEEQRLIETARTALLRRETALARAPLEEHARRFPRGQLTEEREAIWVQVLLNEGQRTQARQRAEAFVQRYPDSLLRPAVAPALRDDREP